MAASPSSLCLLLIALTVTGLTGCRSPRLLASMPESVDKLIVSRKAASLREWQAASARRAVLEKAETGIALLLGGYSSVIAETREGEAGTVTMSVAFSGKDGGDFSAAVPVTGDGYFLTAAHCVENSPLTLVVAGHDLQALKRTVRIVWCGDQKKEPDLAVIHVPDCQVPSFLLGDPGTIRRNAPVALSGWSGITRGQPFGGTAAGNIRSVSGLHRRPSGVVWRVIDHDTPMTEGDSGGPLLSETGEIIGINSLVLLDDGIPANPPAGAPIPGYRAEAIAPDRAWLQGVIAADRALHG